ncbi:hypothetical protein HMPREF9318_00588 [Streptococcus urinalis FB127-CNA-2]|uniref:Uncharacterized protein n=1 Tax=Streptococcus urinalis 2285-97 TaxID=764291 RepID=G5KGM1_9STRE|nr:hypothetical protein [Streptococcus urinalis]EHJ56064.1 hypothetical protein STRUR_1345 [Streptococcus urinalis 2285-97]EKS22390.1 hypothetical protein HMPREF9318_00588 [Streptococcus urinalis FB127-CNA-2]VEF32203.1 putative lipoprotein [Streptococcus urinalis]
MSFLILILYLIFQIINCFGMLLIFAGPSIDNVWWLVLIVPQYWIVRQLALELCRLLGYHALPRMGSFGGGGKVIMFPLFTKITPEYKKLYKSRSILFQFLYYLMMICYWMIIFAR